MALIWTQQALEPKRKFRYLINFSGEGLQEFSFLAQTCDRPGVKVNQTEHKYFDKSFYHPGRVTWDPNPLNIKVVDIQKVNGVSATDTNESLLKVLARSGLNGLIAADGSVQTIGKNQAVSALGIVKINVLNASLDAEPGGPIGGVVEGSDAISETWELKNAWLESFKPESLDYGSDDLLTVTMTVRYDWAQLTVRGNNVPINPFEPGGQT